MKHHIVDGSELARRIQTDFAHAEDAALAVAYWGSDTIETLGLTKVKRLRVICNLHHGGTNPAVIASLIEKGAEVRMHERIHAKIGYTKTLSFCGSSNFSEAGLGLGLTPGHEEANIVFDSCDDGIKMRFDSLWSVAETVTDEALEHAKAAWDATRRTRARNQVNASDGSIIDQLIRDPDRMDDFGLYVVTYTPVDPNTDALIGAANRRAKERYGNAYEVYFGWPELPNDAFLFDLEETSPGAFRWKGIFRRSTDIPDDGEFQLSRKTWFAANDGDPAARIGQGGPRRVVAAIKKALADGALPDPDDDGARIMKASVLAPYLTKNN